jgi:hypothetical protein
VGGCGGERDIGSVTGIRQLELKRHDQGRKHTSMVHTHSMVFTLVVGLGALLHQVGGVSDELLQRLYDQSVDVRHTIYMLFIYASTTLRVLRKTARAFADSTKAQSKHGWFLSTQMHIKAAASKVPEDAQVLNPWRWWCLPAKTFRGSGVA